MVIIDYSKENDPNKEIKTTSENDYGFQDITYKGEQTHVLVPESKQETKNETISTKVPESKQETKIEKGNELEENKPNITNYIEPSIDLENLMDILDNFENIEPNNDLNLNNMDIKKDNIEINMISGTDQPQLKQFSDTHWVSESNNEDWFGDSKNIEEDDTVKSHIPLVEIVPNNKTSPTEPTIQLGSNIEKNVENNSIFIPNFDTDWEDKKFELVPIYDELGNSIRDEKSKIDQPIKEKTSETNQTT